MELNANPAEKAVDAFLEVNEGFSPKSLKVKVSMAMGDESNFSASLAIGKGHHAISDLEDAVNSGPVELAHREDVTANKIHAAIIA